MRKCKELEVRELVDRAKQGVLWWFGHVMRMEKEHLVKKITRSDVRGARPRGKPQMGWMAGLKRVLGVTGMSMEQGRVFVHDKNK